MARLEDFRAKKHDEGHFTAGKLAEAEIFFGKAHPLLERLSGQVKTEVFSTLEQREGKWHPLGFMVYHLGVDRSRRSLRLHIWPEGKRVKSAEGPHIHNHAWHIASRVLVGRYTDSFFSVIEPEVLPSDSDVVLRPYTLRYKSGGTDFLETDGTQRIAKVIERRSRDAGDTHEIKEGIFHVPTISQDRLTATLVLDSPSFKYNTTVIIQGPRKILEAQRRVISYPEALKTKEQLLSERSLSNL